MRKESLWAIELMGVTFQPPCSKEMECIRHRARIIAFDTGVSYTLVPSLDFQEIKDYLQLHGVICKEPIHTGSLVHAHTCAVVGKPPDIVLEIKDIQNNPRRLVIPSSAYLEPTENGEYTLRLV